MPASDPWKDGRQALREIKADPVLAGIPIAVLTTSTTAIDAQSCPTYGVIGCLSKPSSLLELRTIIRGSGMDYLDCGTGRKLG